MATHTISDVLHGIIRFRRDGVTTGDFLLKKTITVANDDLINIVENYTSDSSTNSKTIFRGRIINVDYAKTQYIHAVDVTDELNQIRPSGNYTGYTEVILGRIINGESLASVLCNEVDTSSELQYSGDITTTNWNHTGAGYYYEDLYGYAQDCNTYVNGAVLQLAVANHSLSASYNYYIYKIKVAVRCASPDPNKIHVDIYDGSEWLGSKEIDPPLTYGYVNLVWEDLNLTLAQINNLEVKFTSEWSTSTIYISASDVTIYYKYYPNLVKGLVWASYDFGGNKSIREIIKTLSLVELKSWYIDPDLELHFDSGDIVSGESLVVADKMANIIGIRQIMSYDKVVLYGAYLSGAQIVSSRGAGNIIWRDNYLNIYEQTELDALADQILVEQGANTIKVQLMKSDSADGIYQVGETLAIAEGVQIKFSGSDKYIPDNTTYIINKIDYVITDGVYNYLDMELIDGLLFSTSKDDSLGIVEDSAAETSVGLTQVAGGESVGQANTGSNIGSDGVGVYDGKSGITLQFRNIAPASAAITVVENGNDIDIDFVPAEIDHDALANPQGNAEEQHMTSAQIAALHAVAHTLASHTTKAHTELSDAPADAHHVAFVQANADALYSVLAHLHDDRYYTETEVDNHNWLEADITDLDKLTEAEILALTWVEADITDLDKYTQAEVDTIEDRFDEQSSIFPANPSEGQLHYDEDDDSLFRYNGEAEAWIEIGVGGGKGSGYFDPAIGFIGMFKGTWVDNSTMLGWYKCDGNNGTPNLVDKFIRGAATSGGSGGSDDAVVVSHTHGLRSQPEMRFSNTVTKQLLNSGVGYVGGYIETVGVSGVGANVPVFYELIFIMRVS